MRADLAWWWHTLHDPALPLVYFGELPEPDIVVSTDASDAGLCALVPTLRLALTYRFTPAERRQIEDFKQGSPNEFDINYRKLFVCAFAIHACAPTWRAARPQSRPLDVHFRIDNTSAIAWKTKMASRNPRSQVIIRLISLWEIQFGIRISASHIPGV
ncbi:hypothetical protein PF008_g26670 [Phytophthora fragariae]|uniref:Reverse transcriptase/retrotransposon-derived protein RNase H-like domain-containing protein n=1 Tax=Phytophthora fragariae TaxID=53985 RepID=A0A6G0QH37_9STRA|nr:hypothetical protein PF008_g26670 [Phytophthora fragariae]